MAMILPPVSRQITLKRRRQYRLFVFLHQPGEVVQIIAGASGFPRQAINLRHDSPLFGER